MNDDTALREQLLAAEMQREMGDITDEDFEEIERDLLARIREIKQRREGGSGPLAFGEGEPIETGEDGRFQIEASISGDFTIPQTRRTRRSSRNRRRGAASSGCNTGRPSRSLDIEPVRAQTPREDSALPLPAGRPRTKKTSRTKTTRTAGTSRTGRTSTSRTVRTPRKPRTSSPS